MELLNNTEGQRKVVKKVFSRIVSSSATIAAPMTPAELLLALHEMEENVPLPKAVEGRLGLGQPFLRAKEGLVLKKRMLCMG